MDPHIALIGISKTKPFSTSWIHATWPTNYGKNSASDVKGHAKFQGTLLALSVTRSPLPTTTSY